MTQWQPIETAPKDGTVIDLWVDGERLAKCWWEMDRNETQMCWHQAYAECVSLGFPITDEPSHWMPLPEPPVTA